MKDHGRPVRNLLLSPPCRHDSRACRSGARRGGDDGDLDRHLDHDRLRAAARRGRGVGRASRHRVCDAAIRYPVEIFEPGNIAQYLSVFAGNLFGLGQLETVRLLDVEFPDTLVAPFHGPKFGMAGVRRLVGTTKRPHVGTIIKPKVGLSPEDTARVAYEAAIGGVDLIKDDETLTNQAFCPIVDRVELGDGPPRRREVRDGAARPLRGQYLDPGRPDPGAG